MTAFQICWLIAGVILGWTMPELIVACFRVKVPVVFNLGFAFVGGLVAWSIIR